jgi:hypothetical protein
MPPETEAQSVRAPQPGSLEEAASRLLGEPSTESAPTEAEPETLEETPEEVTEEVTAEEVSESEEETLEEETTEEEEEPEPETEEEIEPAYYSVKINGEEYEVTLDELQSGYQRQKDYTKKTQEIADQRKTYETKAAELSQLHEQFITEATMANELLNRDLKRFQSVDWESLKVSDPVGYVQKQIEMQDIRQQQESLKAQAQNIYEHNLKIAHADRQKLVELEQKEALKLFPDWKSAKTKEQAQSKIVEYARSAGYSDEELGSIVRARDLQMLDKARMYDEMLATKGKISEKKAAPPMRKVAKSKAVPAKSVSKKKVLLDKQSRLQKSGSLRDAAAFMAELQEKNAIRK